MNKINDMTVYYEVLIYKKSENYYLKVIWFDCKKGKLIRLAILS